MKNEKIIIRENGNKLKIVVDTWMSSYSDCGPITYRVEVYIKEKYKRKWRPIPEELSVWEYRKLSKEAHEKAKKENQLRFVTEQEILEVKMKAWQELKPQ